VQPRRHSAASLTAHILAEGDRTAFVIGSKRVRTSLLLVSWGQARRNKPGTTRHCCAACGREESPCQLGAVHTWHLMTFRERDGAQLQSSSASLSAIGGRPSRLPSRLPRCRPARTRSWMIERSNSAKTPNI
jgi:hypothetical protein